MAYNSVVNSANQLSGSSAYQVYGIQNSSSLRNSSYNNSSKSSGITDKSVYSKNSSDKIDISNYKKELTPEQQSQISKLRKTDQKVKAHEMAHISAGGNLVRGGASYNYQTGPDGKQYATGGEVQIDVSTVPNDPDATIRKMEQVKRAALAPSDPSAQDRSVAQTASRNEAEAQRQKLALQSEASQKATLSNPFGKYSYQTQNTGTLINALVGRTAGNESLKTDLFNE